MTTADGSHDMLNRVMTKDNIGLAALFETKETIWENGKWLAYIIFSPSNRYPWMQWYDFVKSTQKRKRCQNCCGLDIKTSHINPLFYRFAPRGTSEPTFTCGHLSRALGSRVLRCETYSNHDADEWAQEHPGWDADKFPTWINYCTRCQQYAHHSLWWSQLSAKLRYCNQYHYITVSIFETVQTLLLFPLQSYYIFVS